MNETRFPQQSPGARAEPVFSAMLTPYRSLGPTGFWVLMLFVGASCFFSGIMFMAMGAWPIAAFLAFDVLLVWGAFKWNYRSARQYETVEVWRDRLKVTQYSPAGKSTEHVFNPFWTRFAVERHDEIGITKMQLREKGHNLDIGKFLNPADKESFANAFSQALSRAKHH